ncbi:MAG: alpha/beta fold hydrolase [Myxococcota bacterium]|nr:alpha/beta fold hydrolase [Myxococcota bacterium]
MSRAARGTRGGRRSPAWAVLGAAAFVATGCSGPPLEPWHSRKLTEEFSVARRGEVRTFADYLALEDRLFAQLDEEVYARVDSGPGRELARYSAGSAADPRDENPDWNRSFELAPEDPVGGVLLLHGMSDSPYSLRALAEELVRQRYRVIGLRLPGHGTAPSGLQHVSRHDMAAAGRLAMAHLDAVLGSKPIHMVGYSTGAALAVEFALDALDGETSPTPASLLLISPAVRIHSAAALAGLKDGLATLPGLGRLAWLQVLPEFDPYKYNSFATNAGSVVHELTRSVDARLADVAAGEGLLMPPILVFKSTVDSTVTTEAVVDHLLGRLAPGRHELVLFDVNRYAARSKLLIDDPGPLTERLMAQDDLPFAVTFVSNADPQTRAVVARRKAPFASAPSEGEPLGLEWPLGVISLSHLALPIAPDDPLYGRRPPEDQSVLFLGEMAMQGERGLLRLPADWLLRMRYNPFYEVLERRVIDWFVLAGDAGPGRSRARATGATAGGP